MIKNGMLGVLSLPNPRKQGKNWGIFINQYIFPLDYVKLYIKGLKWSYKANKYIVHNLTWSGGYLRSTLAYALFQKVMSLVPMTETVPEVYVATMSSFISRSYASLEETLNHLKCLNSSIVWVIMLQNSVLQYWYMMSNLRLPQPWSPTISYISLTYLIILLILYFISGKLRNIRSLKSLLRNFIFWTRMSFNLRISSPMGPLFQRIWVNTVILIPQSVGNPLIPKKSLKMRICLWFLPQVKLNINSSRMRIYLISKYATMGENDSGVESST